MNKKYDVVMREVQDTIFFWNCPKCNEEQSSRTKPHNDHLTCPKCLEKKKTTESQKHLEELFLCAKVVRVKSARVEPYYTYTGNCMKLQEITLLCSDDETLVHIKAPSQEYEEEYTEMSFDIETLEKPKKKNEENIEDSASAGLLSSDIVPKIIRSDRLVITESNKYCSQKYCSYFVGFGINRYPYCNLFQVCLRFDLKYIHRCDECLSSKVIYSDFREAVTNQRKQKFQVYDNVRILTGSLKGRTGHIERIDTYRKSTWKKGRSRKEYTVAIPKDSIIFCCLSYQIERI